MDRCAPEAGSAGLGLSFDYGGDCPIGKRGPRATATRLIRFMTLAQGARFGPFEIVAPLGAGGMGEVYRARDSRLGREVAIKVLPAAFAQDHERVARFRREAQVLASLNHPNIASIHGLEEAEGSVALALELVEGEDLQQRLRRGPIPIDEARIIARQIAEGLEAAHEKGIVHRDLKPANVKVTPEGQVKVLDFGLAKAFDTEALSASGSSAVAEPVEASHSPTMSRQMTEAGMILGTAAYMSPEQARGRTVDKRADIWSFGVVMFEMLSGRRLFQGETASDTLAAVLRQDVDWTLVPKELPAAFRRLIERCLQRDPKQRLRDIGEARVALSETVEGWAMPATPVPSTASSRRDLLRLGLAAAAGVGAGGSGVAMLLRPRQSTVTGEPTALRITPLTGSGTVISVCISPDGRLIAYVESDQGLQSLWLQQVEGGQTLRLIPERGVNYWSHVFTPDGNAIVFGEKSREEPKGALFLISTLGGTPRRLVGDIDSAPTFSPDGQRMAFTRLAFPNPGETALMVVGRDGADPRPLAIFKRPERVAGLFFGGPTWSPDGLTIATSVNRSGSQEVDARAWLASVSVADGRVTTLADPGWVSAHQAQFLPDGRSLLVIARTVDENDTHVWKVSLPGGEARPLTTDLNDHRIVSLTRDGKALASVTGEVSCSVSVISLGKSDRLRRLSRGRNDGGLGITFGEKGHAVYTSFTGRWSLWSADLGGRDRQAVTSAALGERLLLPASTSAGTVYVYARGRTGGEIRVIEKGASAAKRLCAALDACDVSRDGRFLVYVKAADAGPAENEIGGGGSLAHLVRRDLATGAEQKLNDLRAYLPAIDPPGARVAFYFVTSEGALRFGVCAAEGGPLLADLPAEAFPGSSSRIVLRGDGIYVNTVPGDRANVWFLPLDGKPGRKVTAFTDQLLFDFALSDDDEETLLVARGPRLRDAQLITGF